MQDEQPSEPMQNVTNRWAIEILQFKVIRYVVGEIHRLQSVHYFKVMKELEFSASKLTVAKTFKGSELA
jgi:hypothetical protein